ncbi:hypothetical protein [uncultured Gammaproteobacteria bacterium]|nr:hypothetical protein [uncultured Gammaproteobacteria bacterium]CAC9494665.1 hypothetical protein [uncultured Gammaproteobacteria bacterium]CAC9991353.1 hypothetical protein [uncultured Gammaproteobacteria bacterium]
MENIERYICFYNYKRIYLEIEYLTLVQKTAELKKSDTIFKNKLN